MSGELYAFRYRAVNRVGPGPWSETAVIRAAGKPTAPAKPALVASDASSVTLAFDHASLSNRGSEIVAYKLLRDSGDGGTGSSPIATEVTDYDGQAQLFQVSGLSAGLVYRFQYYATNAYGDSPGSAILSAAASRLPEAPGSPEVDWARSGRSSLFVTWAATSTGTLPEAPILGYRLEMDSGNATFVEVFDGGYQPGVLGHLVDGLENGHLYTFRVFAVNYNGASAPSAPASYYACTPPAAFPEPVVESQSTSGMLLRWQPPREDGGCRVTGYAVFRDEGDDASAALSSAISTELNSPSDPAVRGKPSLNSLYATAFPVGAAGRAFRLQVQVFTTQRSALSGVARALLASVPAGPADAPLADPSLTSASQIRVTFA